MVRQVVNNVNVYLTINDIDQRVKGVRAELTLKKLIESLQI